MHARTCHNFPLLATTRPPARRFAHFKTSCKIRQDTCQDMPYIDQTTAVSISALYDFSDSIRLKSLPFNKRKRATNNRRTIIILLKNAHVIYNNSKLHGKKTCQQKETYPIKGNSLIEQTFLNTVKSNRLSKQKLLNKGTQHNK